MKPSTYRVLMAIAFVLLAARHLFAQTAGDVATFKKAAGPGDVKTYTTPVNTSLFSLNGSGNFALLPQSTFQSALVSGTNLRTVQGTSLLGSGNIAIIDDAINDGVTVAGPSQNAVFDALAGKASTSHTHVSADITDASAGGNGTADASKVVLYGLEGQLRGTTVSSAAAIYGQSQGTGYAGYFAGASTLWPTVYINGSGSEPALQVDRSGGGVGLDVSSTNKAARFHALSFGSGTPDIADFVTGLAETPKLTVKFDGGLEWGSTGAATTKTNLGLSNVENTALSTWAGGSSLTTVGIVTSGKWNSDAVAVPYGGTGVSTITGIIKGNGTSAFSAAVSGTDYLTPTGSGSGLSALPSNTALYPTLNQNTTGSAATLATGRTFRTNLGSTSTATFDGSANVTPGVTGTLPVANGGTGATTLNGLVQGNGSSAFSAVSYGNPGAQTLTGVTVSAGSQPSGATNHSYNWTQVGNLVTYQFTVRYASAGTTVTNVLIAFPGDMPAPQEQSGLTSGSDNLYPLTLRATNGTSGNYTNSSTGALRRNAGDSAYEFNAPITSGTYSVFMIFGSYFVQ